LAAPPVSAAPGLPIPREARIRASVVALREIARQEDVDSSYVSRMVNLTILAREIVAAILDETLSPEMTLFDIAVEPPPVWEEQRRAVRF
jgi:hypothetical protein